jgi:hypothetical protein
MKFTTLALGAFLALNAHASLFDYAVYTKKGINAECSDFLGKTGSNAAITLRDFLIQEIGSANCPLESSSTVTMTRGGVTTDKDNQVLSCVRTQNLDAYGSGVTGAETYGVRFKLYDRQMDDVSAILSAGVDADSLVLEGSEFAYKKNITLKGTFPRTLVVTVKGESIKMYGMGIKIEGDIGPQNIIWHFPDANLIELSNTGMKELGIPGTILAPKARLIFNNARVTGAIYANEFVGLADREDCSHRVSGQVNPVCLRSPIPALGCKAPRRGGKG